MHIVFAFILGLFVTLFPVKSESQLYTLVMAYENEELSEWQIEEVAYWAKVEEILAEEEEWIDYHAEAAAEYSLEFDALFEATEVKRAKNGRIMVKGANSKSFKFAPKGV